MIIAGGLNAIVWRPVSTSLVTYKDPPFTSTLEAKVACGQSSNPAKICPVWLQSSSTAMWMNNYIAFPIRPSLFFTSRWSILESEPLLKAGVKCHGVSWNLHKWPYLRLAPKESKVFSFLLIPTCLPLGPNAQSDNFLDRFGGFEISCFLHGNFAKGIDIHASVRKINHIIFHFYLHQEELTFWEE